MGQEQGQYFLWIHYNRSDTRKHNNRNTLRMFSYQGVCNARPQCCIRTPKPCMMTLSDCIRMRTRTSGAVQISWESAQCLTLCNPWADLGMKRYEMDGYETVSRYETIFG